MASSFRFKRFEISNDRAALKVGTDAVLLGAAMTLEASDANLLDIGTGTGVIALMAAQRLSDLGAAFKVEAIDIDAPSADEAASNFAASPWADSLSAANLPLAELIPAGRYDLVFSNPPFYDNSLRNPDGRESAARHTESLSYRDICAFSAQNLRPDGRMSLILPSDCEKILLRTAASFGLYPFRILRVRTTERKAPKRIVAEFSKSRRELREEELVLQDGASRSEEYSSLTRDFYI